MVVQTGTIVLSTLVGTERVAVDNGGGGNSVATVQQIADLATQKDVAITNLNTVGNGTILAAAIVGGILNRGGAQSGTAFTDTTDTAANIIAAMPATAEVGDSFFVDFINTTNAQQTLSGGAGVTLSGVQQVAQNTVLHALVTYSGAGAITIFGEYVVDRGIDNFNLTSDPGVSQDNTQGYGVGSIVFNTTAGQLRWWECRDASTGAAKWVFSGADFANGGTNPSSEVTQAGSSSALIAAEGNINRQISSAGINPGATGADNVLAVYSLPANFFDGTGNRGITITAQGSFAATGNNKDVKIIFNPATAVVGSTVGAGGTTIADSGVVATNNLGWSLQANVFKYGAANSNTQIGLHQQAQIGNAVANLLKPSLITATENAAILIAVTGNATTAASDIVFNFLEVNAMN